MQISEYYTGCAAMLNIQKQRDVKTYAAGP